MRRLICLLLACLPIIALSETFVLDFGEAGDRTVYVSSGDDWFVMPIPVKGKSVEVDADEGSRISVADVATNRLASKPISEIEEGRWQIAAEEYTYLHEVKVQVTSGGEPVATGLVQVSAGEEQRDVLMEEADKGEVTLLGLPDDALRVQVTYKVDGQEEQSPLETFDAGEGVPVLEVELPEGVATVAPAPAPDEGTAATSETGPAPQPEERRSPLNMVITMLVGLAVIGGLAAAGWWWYKQNPQKAEDLAKQAGLGGQPADPAAPAQAPGPVQPKPVEKIVLSDAAPTGAPVTSPAPAPAAAPNPRLVMDGDELALIPEGDQSIGRDASADIAVPGETSMSRVHARLRREGDSVFLSDAGSTNGTYVNGQKIEGERQLAAGDQIMFGGRKAEYRV